MSRGGKNGDDLPIKLKKKSFRHYLSSVQSNRTTGFHQLKNIDKKGSTMAFHQLKKVMMCGKKP
jgi:uncharacterized protein YnzC (UPF0291/DUF896 family)